jgi:type VI secretion system protein ImpB
MSAKGSVAPKERINIVYRSKISGQEEVELPFKMLVMCSLTGKKNEVEIEKRKPINVDKDNFDKVMAAQNLSAKVSVPNKLGGDDQGEMHVDLKFQSLRDFRPEGLAEQVPELRELLELRSALTALKGPLIGGNVPEFRKRLMDALRDPDKRNRLMRELGIDEPNKG